jgi:hypothetical protein
MKKKKNGGETAMQLQLSFSLTSSFLARSRRSFVRYSLVASERREDKIEETTLMRYLASEEQRVTLTRIST